LREDNIFRSKERIKDNGEVFTPTELVGIMLDNLDIDWYNPPIDKKFLDPTCGNGNFLIELVKRGIPLHNIYGVDLMEDNIELLKQRLLDLVEDTIENRATIDNNIRQGDALTYDYNFRDE